MAEIEQAIAEKLAAELDAAEGEAAKPGTSSFHGGPGSSVGLNYSPESSASGGTVVGHHEAGGTRPFTDFVDPTGDGNDAATEQARADSFAEVVAQVKIDRAIADESLRRFRRDPVATTGYVPGLELLDRKVSR